MFQDKHLSAPGIDAYVIMKKSQENMEMQMLGNISLIYLIIYH